MSSQLEHAHPRAAMAPERPPRGSGVPGLPEPTLRLSIPDEGIRGNDVVLRLPRVEDVDALLPAFSDAEIRSAGQLPEFTREQMLETLPHLPALAASGRLVPLIVVDATQGDLLGGSTLHHLDSERSIVEIGYWLLPHARGRGVATRTVRLLAEHAFSLGVERVEAYVEVGNAPSDRVLERAGFTREGVARSLPRPDGKRVDKTQYSLLRGE